MFTPAFRRLFDRGASRPRAAAPQTRSFRPRLEGLEERLLLTGYTSAVAPNAATTAIVSQAGGNLAAANGSTSSTWQAQYDALSRLWRVLSLTKNATQFVWISLQFGQGKDADALQGQPTNSPVNRNGVSWGGVLEARPLIISARVLFDEARHTPGKQQGELVKRGNELVQRAKEFVALAERLWAEMWSDLWRRPGAPAPPETKPVPWDVWLGLTAPAQAQELPNQRATKVENIPWKLGSKWLIYDSPASYKLLTGLTYKMPSTAAAMTFVVGADVVTIFASPQSMRNAGRYAHERAHMIIFTGEQYRDIRGNDIISKTKREQLAYFAGWKAAEQAGDKATAAAQRNLYDQTVEFLKGNYTRVYNFLDGEEMIYYDGQWLLVPKK